MKLTIAVLLVFIVGCANTSKVAMKSLPSSDQNFSHRADFDSALAHINSLESLTKFRSSLTEEQKIAWLHYQVARCESRFGDTELAQRCALNEVQALRLFTILPVNLISEQQLLVTLEVFDYYQNVQQGRGEYSMVLVNSSEPLSLSSQQLVLGQSASTLALFIVSLRDVLNEEDGTVY